MRIIVTGGNGFIGSNLIEKLILNDHIVMNIDVNTYASNHSNLQKIKNNSNYFEMNCNICDPESINKIINSFEPDAIMHLAAESHVDRSIEGPAAFIQTNIFGTFVLLNTCKDYISKTNKSNFRFIHVSTDEVYGSLNQFEDPFKNDSPYKPNSPYAASKASSDHLVRSWHKTYNFPAIITNCCNNYGPHQHVEKFIPKVITNFLNKKEIPVYGDGKNIREWIHVHDHCDALITILEKGKIGNKYLIGSGFETSNLNIIDRIMINFTKIDKVLKLNQMFELIKNVDDRKGHDFRYAIDSRSTHDLGWKPKNDFDQGILETIKWYKANQDWYQGVENGNNRENKI